jgi:hypothetical protein
MNRSEPFASAIAFYVRVVRFACEQQTPNKSIRRCLRRGFGFLCLREGDKRMTRNPWSLAWFKITGRRTSAKRADSVMSSVAYYCRHDSKILDVWLLYANSSG